jgi:enoyl-CoA hydratase/carnithine racemase
MEYHDIRIDEREDGIGIITLNRPEKRNAINIRMRREISSCLRQRGDFEH